MTHMDSLRRRVAEVDALAQRIDSKAFPNRMEVAVAWHTLRKVEDGPLRALDLKHNNGGDGDE